MTNLCVKEQGNTRTYPQSREIRSYFSMAKANSHYPSADIAHKSALLTKKQIAAQLQTTTRYVERMVASGRLMAYKPTGGLVRIRQSALDEFLETGASVSTHERGLQ